MTRPIAIRLVALASPERQLELVGSGSALYGDGEGRRYQCAWTGPEGGDLQNLVKVTVFVTDMRHFDAISEVRRRYFAADLPASTIVEAPQVAGKKKKGPLDPHDFPDGGGSGGAEAFRRARTKP